MRIDFQKLRFQNFLSSGNLWTEIDLNSSKLTLICGSNGAGKSTILDALCFVLFNRAFRNIKKNQMINSITGKNCLVEVEFTAGGTSFKVRRGIKPNIFEIYKDGKLIEQEAATKDYQDYLEKHVLRTNFKTFTQVAILGSASYIPFMQLNTPQRREIIEDLYDLKVFTGMNLLLKERASALQTALKDLETEKRIQSQKLELSRNQQDVLREEKEKQIKEKKDEINQISKDIEEKQSSAEKLKDDISALETTLPNIDKMKDDQNKFLQFKIKIETNKRTLVKEIEFFKVNENCPTCQQGIEPSFKETAIAEKTLKIEEYDRGLEKLAIEIEKSLANLKAAGEITSKISELRSDKYVLDSAITSLLSNRARLELQISKLETEKDETIEQINLKEIEDLLDGIEYNKGDLLKDQEVITYVGVLLKDTGIKAKVIKQFTPVLNQLINSYLAKLDFFVDFNLDENFEETIKSRGRDDFNYQSFSEGEKLRIDLSILFAWRYIAKMRASLDVNICFFDEVLDASIDSEGIQLLIRILKENIEGNLFVISHRDDQISDTFDKVLTFQKVKGFSKLSVV